MPTPKKAALPGRRKTPPSQEPSSWRKTTIKELANRLNPSSPYYEHEQKKDAHFALLLGAGASVESGIPTANEMVEDFRKRICAVRCPDVDKNKQTAWLRKNKYFSNSSSKYGQLFERCFPKEVDRREYIESKVDGRVPSLGYIALAHLIRLRIIDTIITTNFDDLIYVACTAYTAERPVVYSLGNFASEIGASTNRSRVLKLHGDFLFSDIKNTRKEIGNQDPNMAVQVQQILESYRGLVVVGFSGNDKEILKLIERLPQGKYLYWCVFKNERPSKAAQALVKRKGGWFVDIPGFDRLFGEIRTIVGIEDEDVFQVFEARRDSLKAEIGKFNPEAFESFEDVQEVISAATKLKEAQHVEKAEAAFRKAIKMDPKDYRPPFFLARMLRDNPERRDDAIQLFQRAIKLKPFVSLAYIDLANLLLSDPGMLDESERLLRKAIDIRPNDSYPKYLLGMVLRRLRKTDDAEITFRSIISSDSKYKWAYFQLANLIAVDERRLPEAESVLRDVVALFPDYSEAYLALARMVAIDESRSPEAEKLYRKAMALNSELQGVHGDLGLLLMKLKSRRKEAESLLRDALKRNPLSPAYNGRLVRLLLQDGKTAEALSFLRTVIRKNPANVHIHNSICVALRESDRSDDAVKLCRATLKRKVSYPLLDMHMAALHRENNETAKSVECAEKALAGLSTDEHYNRACVYAILGNVDDALVNLQKVFSTRPSEKKWARRDPDFKWINQDPRFIELTADSGNSANMAKTI